MVNMDLKSISDTIYSIEYIEVKPGYFNEHNEMPPPVDESNRHFLTN